MAQDPTANSVRQEADFRPDSQLWGAAVVQVSTRGKLEQPQNRGSVAKAGQGLHVSAERKRESEEAAALPPGTPAPLAERGGP